MPDTPAPDSDMSKVSDWSRILSKGWQGQLLGSTIVVHEHATSTNAEMKTLAVAGAPEGCVLVARAQSEGRGRQGRQWVSPAGKGVYMSVLFRPSWPSSDVGWLAVLAGVAVARMFEQLGLQQVTIKWPNDVLVSGRKIAGILVEPRIGEKEIDFAVVGLGLNISHEPNDWTDTLAEGQATSCAMEGVVLSVPEAAIAVVQELEALYKDVQKGDKNAILSSWSQHGGGPSVPPIR